MRWSSRMRLPTGWRSIHFDFYRFNDPREWDDAGFRDIFAGPGSSSPNGPTTLQAASPIADLAIKMEAMTDDSRTVTLERGAPPRGTRLAGAPGQRDSQGRSPHEAPSICSKAARWRCCSACSTSLRGATILAVRVWPAADYTRVTIESDARLQTQQLTVGSPPRLAVDITGHRTQPAVARAGRQDQAGRSVHQRPARRAVRTGRGAHRVRPEAGRGIPQVFSLAQPVAAYRDRLVLDLHPQEAVDPMEALIAERLRDAPSSTVPRCRYQRRGLHPSVSGCGARCAGALRCDPCVN